MSQQNKIKDLQIKIMYQSSKVVDSKQSCPVTLHNSTQSSFEQSLLKKFSMTDMTLKMSTNRQATTSQSIKINQLPSSSKIDQLLSSNNKINIDQVMVDIKLTPLKSNQFSNKIKIIYQSLNYIKNIEPALLEEVRTAELIVENIQMKYNRQCAQTRREGRQQAMQSGVISEQKHKVSSQKHKEVVSSQQHKELFISNQHKELFSSQQQQQQHQQTPHNRKQNQFIATTKPQSQPVLMSTKKIVKASTCNTDTSPIKHLDEPTSRIFYTNFTIKQIQNSCRKQSTQKKPTSQHYSQSITKNNNMINQSVAKNLNNSTQSNKKLTFLNQSDSNKNSNKNIIHQQQSVSKCKSIHQKTDSGFTVSNFDTQDEQMDRLTKNIQALDKVLQLKGLCIKNQSRGNNSKHNTGLKDTSLNSYKQSLLKSQKKPLMFNSKQRLVFSNKQNY